RIDSFEAYEVAIKIARRIAAREGFGFNPQERIFTILLHEDLVLGGVAGRSLTIQVYPFFQFDERVLLSDEQEVAGREIDNHAVFITEEEDIVPVGTLFRLAFHLLWRGVAQVLQRLLS